MLVEKHFKWQTLAEIGPQVRDYDWLGRQQVDRYGAMATRLVEIDGVETLQLYVLIGTTTYIADDSDSSLEGHIIRNT